jgi:hypothetical protein
VLDKSLFLRQNPNTKASYPNEQNFRQKHYLRLNHTLLVILQHRVHLRLQELHGVKYAIQGLNALLVRVNFL